MNNKIKSDPFRDLSFAEKFSGIHRKTQRRWWQSNPPKFPHPILIEGKLYFRESQLKNWMNEVEKKV